MIILLAIIKYDAKVVICKLIRLSTKKLLTIIWLLIITLRLSFYYIFAKNI